MIGLKNYAKTENSMSDTLTKVQEVVAKQLSIDVSEVKPEANFQNDLGADSLDTVELVMALEEAFDVEIPDEDAETVTTVQAAVDYIDKKKADA
jgi:acyl carrier protein